MDPSMASATSVRIAASHRAIQFIAHAATYDSALLLVYNFFPARFVLDDGERGSKHGDRGEAYHGDVTGPKG
ncbi:unnamed protein product [Linum trigynum]|uniref:Uncharacterized protein n=1 Tax=Linum trigynum TaxID=586398 RepID=A0AAV2GK11_9ROSI